MRCAILILLLIQTMAVFGQVNPIADSLIDVLSRTDNRKERVDLLNSISNQYVRSEPDKAKKYGEKALTAAEGLDYSAGMVDAHFRIGNSYYIRGNYPKTMEHYLAALKILEEQGDKSGQASALMGIGNVLIAQKDIEGALEYQFKSLEIREELGDSLGIAANYNNLGSTFMQDGNLEKALEYQIKSKEIKEALGRRGELSSSYGNIGDIYEAMGQLDKALEHQIIALEIRREQNNMKGQVMSHTSIGKIHLSQGNVNQAINELKKAVNLAEDVGFGDGLRNAWRMLSKAHQEAGDYQTALNAYQQFHEVNDSLFNLKTSEKIAELETVYEVEKKEQALEISEKNERLLRKEKKLQDAEIERQWFLIAGSGASLLFAFLGIYALIRRNRLKQKLNKELEERNLQIMEKNQIIEEHNKDMTDSIEYARTIQSHLLPSNEIFNKHCKEHFVLYKPRDIVSGDFYWGHHTNEKTFIIVSDCTGHGVPGSLLSMLGQNMLNQIVIDGKEHDPGMILEKLNHRIHRIFTKGDKRVYDGMDITAVVIDRSQQLLHWAAANHFMLRSGPNGLERIEGDRNPIGGRSRPDDKFTTHKMPLEEGVCLYMFSDGYVDQFGGKKGKKLKANHFAEVIERYIEQPMKEQRAHLDQYYEEWKGDFEQIDDVCVLGIRL